MTCIYARLSAISCIIVDSTRRGKSMPDALSKSVPIWIAVWNRMLFPDDPNACQLKTPEDVVPPSEHSQIEVRLDQFLAQLTVGLSNFHVLSTLSFPCCRHCKSTSIASEHAAKSPCSQSG